MSRTCRPNTLLPALAVTSALACGHAFALDYSCDELADMAARFYTMKEKGYSLEDVTATIQRGSKGKPEKEALLGNLAVEVYIDPAVNSVAESRELARSQCTR